MPTAAPQHLRQRPARATLRQQVTLRRAAVLAAGAAVAVPGSLAGLAPTAVAAPVTPQAAPGVPSALPQAPVTLPQSPTSVVVLHYGSTGSLVKTLQSRLGITADGSFGPITLRAVKAFQERKGLEVDGYVGPLTWAALGGFPGTAPAPSPTPAPPETCSSYVLRYGSFGEMVKVAQSRLGITADGDFGPATLSAVKAYQSRKGLEVDGIVGPITWRSLGGYPCDTPDPTPAPDPSAPSEPAPEPEPGASYNGQDVLDIAKKYLGTWYVYGGSTPAGFDCSGFTQYVYRQVGVNLPRTSLQQSQFRSGVSLNDLRVGDLVFFYSPVSHVAIYAGNGMIIDSAKPGTQISIHKMWVSPVKAIRLV